MKPDFAIKAEKTPKITSSQQRAAEAPEDVLPSHEASIAHKSLGSSKDAAMQDAEDEPELVKLPRLPSIKHLQLDMGHLQSPWPMADQYLSQKSPMLHSGASSPLSISPIGTPIDMLFAPSPPMSLSMPPSPVSMLSPPQTPTIQANPIPLNAFASLSAANFASVKSLFSSSSTPAASSSSQPSTLAPSAFSRNVSLLAQDPIPNAAPAASTVSNNFGFIETTFSSAPSKKTHRRRPANVDKGSLYCHNCGAKNTPEWRRGPGGPATLCNACGLAYAKRLRQDDDIPQTPMQLIPTPLNLVAAAASGIPLNGFNSCSCAQATTYGSCVHMQHLQPQPQRPPPTQPQQQQQAGPRPMQMVKGMPIRINSHTFHNYTPPTPHPSVQQRNQGAPIMNQITFY